MTKIYVIGYYTGNSSYGIIRDAGRDGDVHGMAFTVGDGYYNIVASHLSSGKYWYEHDMGITSDWKHNTYKRVADDGEYNIVNLGVMRDEKECNETMIEIVKMVEKLL